MMPWCLDCGSTQQLEADHILPAVLFPELIYEPLNVTTRCRTHNARRGINYTEAEERQVCSAIQDRRDRNTKHVAALLNG